MLYLCYYIHEFGMSFSGYLVDHIQLLCSSQAEANQFTGMVYQGLLLSERRRLRTESIEEHASPNSPPASWPGEVNAIDILYVYCL